MGHGADMVAVARAAIGHADWASHISDEMYDPSKPPFSSEHLEKQGLSQTFIQYMRGWDGFVSSRLADVPSFTRPCHAGGFAER